MAQSRMRALKRGSLNRISSTKLSPHSSQLTTVYRKNRYKVIPSAEKLEKQERRKKRISDPNWRLEGSKWVFDPVN
jgi:hypothetical protein